MYRATDKAPLSAWISELRTRGSTSSDIRSLDLCGVSARGGLLIIGLKVLLGLVESGPWYFTPERWEMVLLL